jgi:hypothetical protein
LISSASIPVASITAAIIIIFFVIICHSLAALGLRKSLIVLPAA